jgi:hypothetical protein
MTGVTTKAILRLLEDLGCACAEYHNRIVCNLKYGRVEVDEIWQFGYGDVWTTTGIGADSKLIISYLVGAA